MFETPSNGVNAMNCHTVTIATETVTAEYTDITIDLQEHRFDNGRKLWSIRETVQGLDLGGEPPKVMYRALPARNAIHASAQWGQIVDNTCAIAEGYYAPEW